MAKATAMLRYPKFQNRKSLDLSHLSSSQPLKKRPQNLSLKPTLRRPTQDTTPAVMSICETDSSMDYDKKGPSEIRPYLFLGSQEHASKISVLRDYKIDAILNVTTEIENFFPNEGLEYCNCPVMDTPMTNIYSIFETCFAFIDKIRASGRRVLVHCHAGVSRSATICVAYLMRTEGMKYEHAMKWVVMCRPVVAPNLGFLAQLMDFEYVLESRRLVRRPRASSFHGLTNFSIRPIPTKQTTIDSPSVVNIFQKEFAI